MEKKSSQDLTTASKGSKSKGSSKKFVEKKSSLNMIAGSINEYKK